VSGVATVEAKSRLRPVRETVSWRESWRGFKFASPWLIGFFAWTAAPLIFSILLSFMEWNGLSLSNIRWAGLDNYREIFRDEDEVFWISLWNTFYYSFISVPCGLTVSLALAMLLNARLRGISVFRTLYYLPNVVAGVATMVMWVWVFNPDFGLVNTYLRDFYGLLARLGIEGATRWPVPAWLHSELWSKPALIVMALWGAGGAMLIFLAALQNVPDHLYEAARIDGAGRLAQFWHVTVPHLTPAVFFNLVMGIIGSFQVFTQAYVMTGGGPSKSTLFYVLHLYVKGFEDFEFGLASALAWILFVIIMVFTLLVLRSSRLWVYYEAD